jgi:hypothetical protein
MSYEGYDMVLCELGHLSEYDVYSPRNPTSPSERSWNCYCGAAMVWSSSVDTTNGKDETGLCPGEVVLEEIEFSSYHRCECGNKHEIPAIYKIPEKGIGTHY